MPPAAAVWGMLTELLEVELEVELPAAAEPVADVDDVDEDMMEEGWRQQRTQLGRRRAGRDDERESTGKGNRPCRRVTFVTYA